MFLRIVLFLLLYNFETSFCCYIFLRLCRLVLLCEYKTNNEMSHYAIYFLFDNFVALNTLL